MGTTARTIDRHLCDFCGVSEDVTRGPMAEPMRGEWFSAEFEELKGSPESEVERKRPPISRALPYGESPGPWLPLIVCGECWVAMLFALRVLRRDRKLEADRRKLTNLSAQHLEESDLVHQDAFPSVSVQEEGDLLWPSRHGTHFAWLPSKTVTEEVAERIDMGRRRPWPDEPA